MVCVALSFLSVLNPVCYAELGSLFHLGMKTQPTVTRFLVPAFTLVLITSQPPPLQYLNCADYTLSLFHPGCIPLPQAVVRLQDFTLDCLPHYAETIRTLFGLSLWAQLSQQAEAFLTHSDSHIPRPDWPPAGMRTHFYLGLNILGPVTVLFRYLSSIQVPTLF